MAARLLQILPGVAPGGIERYGLTIGLAAASEGWAVHAAFPHTADNAELQSAYREGGVTTHALDHRANGPAFWEVVTAARRTARLVAGVRPDVVHANVPIPNFARGNLIGCALRRVPTVVVFHTAPPDLFDLGRSRRLYPLLHARGQVWVTVSEHDRGELARAFGVPAADVTVIRNGVAPVVNGAPSAEERAELRRKLGLPADAFVALSVGRLAEQKGYDYLISAASELAKRFPRLHFVIAGEGEARGKLEGLVAGAGLKDNVHLAGQRDDVDRLLRAADLFLLPSRYEGFPFALLDAAAHGLPIIASDVGGTGEIVSHGDSGLVIQPHDVDELRRSIEFALEHPDEMRAMGDRAKRSASRFSHEAMVRSTLALLAAPLDTPS